MRGGLVIVATLFLSGCASVPATAPGAADASPPPQAAPAGQWKIEQRADRIAGATVRTAVLITRAENSYAAARRPFLIKFAALQLMCFRGEPIVRFAFNFRVGANRSASVEYRFDDKPGRQADARFLSDFQTIVIEDPAAVAQFAGALAGSSAMHLRVSSLIVGQTNAAYPTEGAANAIEQAYASCPLQGPAARRR